MDGENNGNPYSSMDDLEENPTIFGVFPSIWKNQKHRSPKPNPNGSPVLPPLDALELCDSLQWPRGPGRSLKRDHQVEGKGIVEIPEKNIYLESQGKSYF